MNEKKKESKSFLSNFLTLGISSFIYLLVGLIGTPVVTRLVDPVDYALSLIRKKNAA